MNQAYIDRVVQLTNIERQKVGLPPLKFNSQLARAAQEHTNNMAKGDFFSHSNPNGSSMGSRISATGYPFAYAAENIHAGGATPEEAVNGWMNSPGHRRNILSKKAKEIGVGYYFLANDGGKVKYKHYWTQVFAASR